MCLRALMWVFVYAVVFCFFMWLYVFLCMYTLYFFLSVPVCVCVYMCVYVSLLMEISKIPRISFVAAVFWTSLLDTTDKVREFILILEKWTICLGFNSAVPSSFISSRRHLGKQNCKMCFGIYIFYVGIDDYI